VNLSPLLFQTASQLRRQYTLTGAPVSTSLIKYNLNILYVVLITCKKCGDINYLTSETLGNVTDFGYKCRNCNAINRITLEDGELKKQE
jgi:RNase P subunit RPR2